MRALVAAGCTLLVLALAVPVLAGPVMEQLRTSRCEPSSWREWHVALRRQCLEPAYVCENMKKDALVHDPDLLSYGAGGHGLPAGPDAVAELVRRMRQSFGCGPEADEPRTPASEPELGTPVMPTYKASRQTPLAL